MMRPFSIAPLRSPPIYLHLKQSYNLARRQQASSVHAIAADQARLQHHFIGKASPANKVEWASDGAP